MRQLTDPSGQVTLAKSYDPYGTVTASNGTSQSIYGFTAEQTDASGLVYLRARYYNPNDGRFITGDPSGMDENLFLYASANPINMKDPTGLFALPGPGFIQFGACLSMHTLSFGNSLMPARLAVDTCKEGFSKDMWNQGFFNLSGDLPTTAHDLFGWYIFERGNNFRLDFDANEPLTQELSKSISIRQLRSEYYNGGIVAGPNQYKFGLFEQGACLADAFTNEQNFRTMPLTCLLGSFYYQIKSDGDYVGFRIDNRTDLGSGTHIPFRFEGGEFGGSVEELLDNGDISDWTPLNLVVNRIYHGKKVVTILKPRDRSETGEWTNFGISRNLGGGNLVQTYTWKEKQDPCWKFPYNFILFPPQIYSWDDYRNHTAPIEIWGETY